jgi:hypothetical protein
LSELCETRSEELGHVVEPLVGALRDEKQLRDRIDRETAVE